VRGRRSTVSSRLNRQEPGGAGGKAWQAPDHYFGGTISDKVALRQVQRGSSAEVPDLSAGIINVGFSFRTIAITFPSLKYYLSPSAYLLKFDLHLFLQL